MPKDMRGVSDRQMRRQASHIDERRASREDRIIREAANAFAKQLQSAASIDYKDYNDPKNFVEAWHDFEEFFFSVSNFREKQGTTSLTFYRNLFKQKTSRSISAGTDSSRTCYQHKR